MKNYYLIILLLISTVYTTANNVVKVEHVKKEWNFTSIMKPSRSDIAFGVDIQIIGNNPIPSCLSLKGLTNGIMPRECRLLRDFFCFTNDNALGGKSF